MLASNMGYSASFHNNSPGSVLNIMSFGPEIDNLVIPQSLKKEKSVPETALVASAEPVMAKSYNPAIPQSPNKENSVPPAASVDKSNNLVIPEENSVPAAAPEAVVAKNDNLVIPKSPEKENSVPATAPVAAKSDNLVIPESTRKETSVPVVAKSDSLVIPESARKENLLPATETAVKIGRPMKTLQSFPSSNKSSGSKDEGFCDAQADLESDGDDDFYSVRGEFTPSRGNTPINSFSGRTPWVSNLLSEDKASSSSLKPTQSQRRRKTLFELFKESSIREESEESEDPEDSCGTSSETSKKSEAKPQTIAGLPPKSDHLNTKEDSVADKEKPLLSFLLGLVSCGRFYDKKTNMSPPMAVNY